ncbi:MAG: hypothetical protein R3C44_21110 [Chloroflexota bacterium]
MARTRSTKPQLRLLPATAGLLGLVAVIGGLVWIMYPANKAAHQTAAALVGGADREAAVEAGQVTAETQCALHWYKGLLLQRQGNITARDTAWTELLSCTDRFNRFMPVLAPDSAGLAQAAVERQPSSPWGISGWRRC